MAVLLCLTGPVLAQEFVAAPRVGRFQVFYSPNSLAAREQSEIVARREQALRRLEEFFQLRLSEPITLLLYPSYEAAGAMRGNSPTVAIVYPPGKWAYERHHPGHELVYLFTHHGTEVVGLLDEGLAESLSGWDVDPHLRCTDALQAQGRRARQVAIAPEHIDDRSASVRPLAGSFVKYLIDRHGRQKVLELWRRNGGRKSEFIQDAEEVLAHSWPELLADWNRVLEPYWQRRFPLDRSDRQRLEAALRAHRWENLENVRYSGFEKYLRLVAELSDGRSVEVVATEDDGWKPVAAPRLPAERVDEAMSKGVFLLDVRTPKEIAELGSLPGYTNIPIDELEKRLDELPRDRDILTA